MEKNSRRVLLLLFVAGLTAILAIFLKNNALGGKEMRPCRGGADKMQGASNAELPVGSNDEAIRVFLNKHNFTFTYDRFANRYQGIYRNVENPPGVDCAIVGHIYVDKEKKFLRSEFIASYTGV